MFIFITGLTGRYRFLGPARFGPIAVYRFLWLIACSLFLLAIQVPLAAATDSIRALLPDTNVSHIVHLDTVTVTAIPLFDWRHAISSIQTIPLSNHNNINSLSSAITDANGLFIRDYGGGDALATLSTRGMYAEETSITIDGIRINSQQNGVVDLSKIPLLGLSMVQINRGGGTVGFDETSGGTIELMTSSPTQSFTPMVGMQLGSFGEHAGSFMIPVNTSEVYTTLLGSYSEAVNNYAYTFDGITNQRASADYKVSYFSSHSTWSPNGGNDNTTHELILSLLNSNQGVANAVSSVNIQPPGGRETDQDWFALLHSQWRISDSMPLETSIHVSYSHETFLDSTCAQTGNPFYLTILTDGQTFPYEVHGI